MAGIKSIQNKKVWYENFLYIFNSHWNKVDNFRIDKYLMFLRFMFNQLLRLLKETNNDLELTQWYQKIILDVFLNSQKQALTASGIALQICDVFVQELNKVDAGASLDVLASLLDPFLKALGVLESGELKERISEQIFKPILENNKTMPDESSEDEEKNEKNDKHYREVDGGRMNPNTKREVLAMINQKYIFNAFNILIYAQNYILKYASTTEKKIISEPNREEIYKLYEYALELEPKPDRPELTFT